MSKSSAAQVVLYSEEPFLAEGLASAFRTRNPEFELRAFHTRLPDALAGVRERTVDILLLDVTEQVTTALLRDLRHADPQCRIVLWTSTISRELAFQAMELGVRGILPKSASIERSLAALRSVKNGETWFEKETLETFLYARRVVLTRREGQLVTLLSQGLKNKEIGWTLQISEGTVKVYLSRLFKKLGVNDRLELALCGLRNMQSGYLNPGSDRYGPDSLDRAKSSLVALRTILVDSRDEASSGGTGLPAGRAAGQMISTRA